MQSDLIDATATITTITTTTKTAAATTAMTITTTATTAMTITTTATTTTTATAITTTTIAEAKKFETSLKKTNDQMSTRIVLDFFCSFFNVYKYTTNIMSSLQILVGQGHYSTGSTKFLGEV